MPSSTKPSTTASSTLGEGWQILIVVAAVTTGLALLTVMVYFTRDSMALGKHLAEAQAQRTAMVCQDGRMVHGDNSLRDRLVEDGAFVCTEWRTLQSIDLQKEDERRARASAASSATP